MHDVTHETVRAVGRNADLRNPSRVMSTSGISLKMAENFRQKFNFSPVRINLAQNNRIVIQLFDQGTIVLCYKYSYDNIIDLEMSDLSGPLSGTFRSAETRSMRPWL